MDQAGFAPAAAKSASRVGAALLLVLCFGNACRQAMYNDAKLEPLKPTELFADGASARPLVKNTVARGHLRDDQHFYEGLVSGYLAETFPSPVTTVMLQRGQERYDVYCSVCHGPNGNGNGMIVQRGFPAPPSFHNERLRAAPPGHLFHVITHGYGVMYPYAQRVGPGDRWAIAAYIRALQLSHHSPSGHLTEAERATLEPTAP
jgi:mono/diheme cytochrome c family protein